MNYRDIAVALEAEADVRGFREKLETVYDFYDRTVCRRAGNPYIVAWINFIRGGDVQIKQIAALWLYRHDQATGDDPIMDPALVKLLDQTLIDTINNFKGGVKDD
jgi:hypothetical protein